MRYVWIAEEERDRVRGIKGVALAAFRGRLRRWDRRASQRPDVYVANSTAVAERIERFYGREAPWCRRRWPPQDFPRDVERDPAHFLWVHRLVRLQAPARGGRGVSRAAATCG